MKRIGLEPIPVDNESTELPITLSLKNLRTKF
jgi:hypothetical protein